MYTHVYGNVYGNLSLLKHQYTGIWRLQLYRQSILNQHLPVEENGIRLKVSSVLVRNWMFRRHLKFLWPNVAAKNLLMNSLIATL